MPKQSLKKVFVKYDNEPGEAEGTSVYHVGRHFNLRPFGSVAPGAVQFYVI